jgi:hypothetical protein
MKYLILIGIALMIGIGAWAHAAQPKASGYLSDYHRLVEGEYLEAYWVDAASIERSTRPLIGLGDIAVNTIKDHKGVTVSNCVGWLKKDLLASPVIVDDASAPYILDLAITHMDPGSRAKRLWAGEFGAGHAQLQIEGRVVDSKTGDIVAEFAERRRSSGALGAKDLSQDAGPHIIEHLVQLVSSDAANELHASFLQRQ